MSELPTTVQRWVSLVRDAGGSMPVEMLMRMSAPIGALAIHELVKRGLATRKGANLVLVKE